MEKDKDKKFEKYKLLINARNFHYDNFNKWMTYYYVAIGALFVGYYTLLSGNKIDDFGEYSLMILGLIISLFWYWSCKGYYFWNINFISLVNNYEKEILEFEEKERVYFVFANKKTQNNYLSPISGANISTSKVTILFAFTVSIMWGILLIFKVFEQVDCLKDCNWLRILLSFCASILTVITLSSIIPKNFLKSKIDHFPDLQLTNDKK
ncbi:MAG: hypothetical protein GX259_03575 [Bacteroidales bacterium]|nr:hypothetical protein [Bacteroidales bacterium]